jgi:hypothetical protein
MLDKYDKNKLKRKSEESRCMTQNSTEKNNYFFQSYDVTLNFYVQVFMWNIRISVKR